MPNPVAYFELGGRHASELREFYKSLFGWKVEPFGPSAAGTDFFHVEPEEGGIAGGILQTAGEMPPNYVMFYVSVDDLQASLDKVERWEASPSSRRCPYRVAWATSRCSWTRTTT